ncbi:P-loop containing nucleoside triphosphate hydrolase protein [Schizophyllum amplum]|uniref:P-loop containing nucleoside triphosphate hydrolase protein n=1 Tax=Schizophyllum amplum TaxID=97359 RepID=A0A550CP55_9AGAR|nr:P-loop containing nucleoside triphosphate hydrolase protein [Auriculariopsis ampla]
MAVEPTLSTLAQMAAEAAPDMQEESSGSAQARTQEQMKRHYVRQLHKVIDESDIIILVLDARDPDGCRSRLVEEEVRRRESEGKKLVFVLNKVDLVPKANAQAWLKYLRHSTPTLPFLSANQHQRNNLSSSTSPALLKLLKAYKPKAGSVTIGVVGYPNVGKSSLINSLKRSKACAIASQPGHTKELQSVQLERGMRIVDSPGVVFDDDGESADVKGARKGSVLLRNVVRVDDVEDPIAVVEEIVARTEAEALQRIYNLPAYSSTLEFLTMVALSAGKLLKGGTPDINTAARQILNDWNHQKIPYYSNPPEVHSSQIPSLVPGTTDIAPGAENVGNAQIVTQFAQPFVLDGLFGAADAGAFDGDTKMDDGQDAEEMPFTPDDDMVDPDVSTTSLKRPRSPSPNPIAGSDNVEMGDAAASPEEAYTRQPKRMRKNHDLPEYEKAQNLGKNNPMNRRSLKKDAKRARKIQRLVAKAAGESMVVDEGLASTFMTA